MVAPRRLHAIPQFFLSGIGAYAIALCVSMIIGSVIEQRGYAAGFMRLHALVAATIAAIALFAASRVGGVNRRWLIGTGVYAIVCTIVLLFLYDNGSFFGWS